MKKYFTLLLSLWVAVPLAVYGAPDLPDKISLTEALERISQSYDVYFTFDRELTTQYEVDYSEENYSSAEEAIQIVLKGTNLSYQIFDEQFVIVYLNDDAGLNSVKKMITHLQGFVHQKEKDVAEKAKRMMVPVDKLEYIRPEILQLESYALNINGTILSSEGEPLIGVNILVKGTGKGTTSDLDGRYFLNDVDEQAVLIFSYIGYQTQEVPVSGRQVIDVTLLSDAQLLEQVIVVGYGIQKKESAIGSIVQATAEDIKRTGNVTDLKEALTGQLPGVISLTSSGEPGGVTTGESATNIFIRGQNTWNGGQPLILVDGVERNMSNVDVNEVASISVLKDASATAVFGVKGANGVILITTKRGQVGKTQLSFNYTTTGKSLSKQPSKLDSYAAMMAKNEIIEREGVLNEPSWNSYIPYPIVQRYQTPQSPEYALIYPNVDWEDEMFKDLGFSHRATLSARGGSEVVQYFGSLAYLHEGDMFTDYDNGKGYEPNYNFDRFNFRSNIDIQATRTTKIKLNLSGYYSLKNTNYNNEGSSSRADSWMWRATYGLAPNLFLPVYPDGRWGAYQEGGNNTVNPLAVVYNIGLRQTRTTQLNSDFTIEQDFNFITKGLSAKASLFFDNSIRSEGGIYDIQNSVRPAEARTNVPYKQIYPLLYQGPGQDPSEYTLLLPQSDEEYDWILRPWSVREEQISQANWSNYIPINRRLMYQLQMNYGRQINKHYITAMGVFKREEYARGSEFKHYREDWVFRATYDFDTRYLLEANGAYNGSEKFGPGYRYDFFPSVGLGWIPSNETFFKVPWVDRLKLRYSIGKVGDDNVSGQRWLYSSQLGYGGSARLNESVTGSSPYTFYRESVVGNPNIHWEVAVKSNYGLEAEFLNQLITLGFDYYNESRSDILMSGGSRNVPPFFGATPPSANLGEVESNGFELELGLNKTLNPNLDFWVSTAFTHNENTIISRDDAPLQFEYLKQAGYPIGQQKRLLRTEFYDNWDEVYASVQTENNDHQKLPGYYDLIDFNADGIIKGSEDTPPIGYSGVPQNSVNVSLGGNFKGWSMMIQVYGTNNANRYIGFNNYASDIDIVFGHVADYWSSDNHYASSFLPRWKTQAENIGDYYLYDGSYIRLRTVELAYNFEETNWMNRIGFSNLRIFLNGTNLYYWSDLPDDRQSTYSDGSATQGAYPTVKRINLGIELNL